jgi:hypothetical protein
MKQKPEGQDGEITAEQRRRAAYYALNTMAVSLGEDDEKVSNLLDKMRLGFRTTPAKKTNTEPE